MGIWGEYVTMLKMLITVFSRLNGGPRLIGGLV